MSLVVFSSKLFETTSSQSNDLIELVFFKSSNARKNGHIRSILWILSFFLLIFLVMTVKDVGGGEGRMSWGEGEVVMRWCD